MRKRRDLMWQQISNVNGQIQYLKNIIDKNHALANENMRLAALRGQSYDPVPR